MNIRKVLWCSIIIFLFINVLIGQSPEKMSFQAVIRDASGELVSNSSVGLKMSVLQGSVSGTLAYSETHNGMTNSNGLITLEIGGGTVVSGVYGDIDWSNGPYFLKREIDPSGGTNYVVSGTSQLLSVPYAMYANVADTVLNAPDTSSINEIQVLSISNDTIYLSGGGFVKLPSGFDGDYSSLTNKPTIPTNTSDLTNDSGFITSEVDSSTTNEIQELSVSLIGDTLYLSQSNYVIIPGLSSANPPVSDIDGNGYDTVHIGTQIWMKSNLKTTHYNDGTPIQHVTDGTTWSGLTTGARVYYDNDSTTNAPVYGALYNWYAVETGKLCPSGWHVPTNAEWTVLTTFVGTEPGNKLKEIGTSHWPSDSGATDAVGFTALPGGRRLDSGSFDLPDYGFWWSETPSNSNNSYCRFIFSGGNYVDTFSYDKRRGLSVRCLRD
jgi:uncharacterized protein (TIGR02145 family)